MISPPGALLLAACRTPFARVGGRLASVEAYDLAAACITRIAAGLRSTTVDRVVVACAAAPGNVARLAALAAGLPPTAPAMTINAQCSGGLAAVRVAAEAIVSGGARVVLAGGTESCSHSMVRLGARTRRNPAGGRDLPATRHAPPGLADPDMGLAADAAAARLGIARAAQDAYAHAALGRVLAAQRAGFFRSLITPVATPAGPVDADDLPRRLPALERLGRYPPAFRSDGTVTAATAAAPADGAALLAVAGPAVARACGFHPLGGVRAAFAAADDPADPSGAVLPAIAGLLDRAGIDAKAIDRWEINEAFAVKIVAAMRHFDLDPERVNVHGGALGFGHPFSASGAALLVHLLAELRSCSGRLGVAAVAGAGGIAEAMLIEAVD